MTITASTFTYISQLVRSEAGIVLDAGKEYLVESRLLPVAKKAGHQSLEELASALRSPTNRELLSQVIEAMTTNETLFFRDQHPFDALKADVLPALFSARSAQRKLSLWCAAASTGQEPYSIAISLRESGLSLAGWNIDFLATDLSKEVLERARSGKYSQLEINRGMPAALLVKYFDKKVTKYQVKPEILAMVKFAELNLTRAFPRMGPLDIVFIRNVLIYFDERTKADILRKIHKVMRPDGYLFLGGTETILNLDVPFERKTSGRAVYYRPR